MQARLDAIREELVSANQAVHAAQATANEAEQRVQQAEEQARVARLERDQAITQAQVGGVGWGGWKKWCTTVLGICVGTSCCTSWWMMGVYVYHAPATPYNKQ